MDRRTAGVISRLQTSAFLDKFLDQSDIAFVSGSMQAAIAFDVMRRRWCLSQGNGDRQMSRSDRQQQASHDNASPFDHRRILPHCSPARMVSVCEHPCGYRLIGSRR